MPKKATWLSSNFKSMRSDVLPIILMMGLLTCHVEAESIYTSKVRLSIPGDPAVNEYRLSSPFIFAKSDSVMVGNRILLRNVDYSINYNNGTVYLASPLRSQDTLVVFYTPMKWSFPKNVQYLPLLPDTFGNKYSQDSLAVKSVPDNELAGWTERTGSQLSFGGSKSIGISLGSGKDMSLEQSLNARINGRLGQNLQINALLSDQGMPLTGSTQELSQIDKVYIRASSDNWAVTVGDYDLSYQKMPMINLQRQLQGLNADFSHKSNSIGFSVSNTKGRSGYNRISGRDGIQGPYQLSVQEGVLLFRVLANSERIWLDGSLLKKGPDKDYTFDYDKSQVIFTPRHIITSDSRITVEFEYSLDSFSRDLYVVRSEMYVGHNFSISGAYFQEADDPEQPSSGEMDALWRGVLEKAGDDTVKLWGDGGVPADSGQGDYDKVDSIYVFAGKGMGRYSVAFTWVGSGKGDYIYDSLSGSYVFAGPDQGDYVARKKYPRPDGFKTLGMQIKKTWEGGQVILAGAGTRKDLNLMSRLGDEDNQGTAGRYELYWKRDSLGWGGFELSGRGIGLGNDFNRDVCSPESDFESRWGLGGWTGLKSLDPFDRQRSQEYKAGYWPNDKLKFGGGWGKIRLGDGIWLHKYLGQMSLGSGRSRQLNYGYKKYYLGNAWTDGNIASALRQEHNLTSQQTGRILSVREGISNTVDAFNLQNGNQSGNRVQEGFLGLGSKSGVFSWDSRYVRREDYARDSTESFWKGISHTDQVNNILNYENGNTFFTGIEYTYRSKTIRPNAVGQNQKSNLALLKIDYASAGRLIRSGLNYSLNFTEARLLRETYIMVGAGAGDFTYDSLTGTFFADTAGNYVKKTLEEGSANRACEISARSYLKIDPGQNQTRSWWKGFRFDLSMASSVKSLGSLDGYLLTTRPALGNRVQDLSGAMDATSETAYYGDAGWNMRFIYRWRRDRDNQTISAAIVRRTNERKLEAGYPFNNSLRSSFYVYSQINETFSSQVGQESSNNPSAAGSEWNLTVGRSSDAGLKLELGKERVERYNLIHPVINYEHWQLIPSLTRRLFASGQIRIEGGLTYRKADRDLEDIPMEFRYTRELGLSRSWRTNFDYRINNYLTIMMSYDGRKEDDKISVHNGRMEVKAYF